MMFWLFLTQKKANKEKTVMTLTAELTFQKILSSIELDSDCVERNSEIGQLFNLKNKFKVHQYSKSLC